ncbi:alpha/beta hydrolase [Streptomyces anandii]|uniref:alpha/beta hydrolase n=1 Tax=Streptomyces anandii TaxID=285454 RepID=UPI0036FDDF80
MASPVFAGLAGLPPLLVQAGANEVLLDDAVRLAGRAGADDVEVTLEIGPGLPTSSSITTAASTRRTPRSTAPPASSPATRPPATRPPGTRPPPAAPRRSGDPAPV